MSAVASARLTESLEFTLMLPPALLKAALRTTSAAVPSAVSPVLSKMSCFALISPVASVVVMPPLSVTSTKLAPLSTSSCVAVLGVAVAPSAATRLTLRLIVSSVRSSASLT